MVADMLGLEEAHVINFVILVVVAVLTSLLLLTRRNPVSYVLSFFRALYRATIRKFIRALRTMAGLKVTAALDAPRGPTLFAALARLFKSQTITDQTLARIAKRRSVQLTQHNELFFSWLRPTASSIPSSDQYTAELARIDAEKSNRVFHYNLPVTEVLTGNERLVRNPETGDFDMLPLHEHLYEDVHSSLIIRLFRGDEGVRASRPLDDEGEGASEAPEDVPEPLEEGPDDVYYHVINSMRKTINDNTRMLASILSLILAVNVLIIIYCFDLIQLFGIENESWRLPLGLMGQTFYTLDLTHTLIVTGTTLVSLFLTWIMYSLGYRYAQRNNGRELDAYVRAYLAHLNNRFREADASLRDTIGGVGAMESDGDQRDMSGIWFMNMHWIAWRCFFVEWYLRSMFYQVVRNTSYYMFFIPVAFLVALLVSMLLLNGDLQDRVLTMPVTNLAFFAVTFWVYLRCITSAGTLLRQTIDEDTWMEFHRLRLEETTNAVIKRFLREIQNWRDRYRQSGPGGGG
ncbi:MAG: hypothetical protein ACFB6R_09405 [Alphaproteobacteria bacterium]